MACVLKWLRLEPESARTNDVNLTSLNQYDQIGQFWNVLGTNFVSKIAQIFSDNLDYFDKLYDIKGLIFTVLIMAFI